MPFSSTNADLILLNIVEVCYVADIKAQRDCLGLTGGEKLRLFERGELFCGLAELALRRAVIELNDLFAGHFADVFDRHRGDYLSVALAAECAAELEISIESNPSRTDSELFRRRRESSLIAVADIYVIKIIEMLEACQELLRVLI